MYDLRAERGAILRHGIIVNDNDVAIGAVSDLAPLAPARLFDLEEVFPTLLTSPAPSTAYIFTHDPTVVPASARGGGGAVLGKRMAQVAEANGGFDQRDGCRADLQLQRTDGLQSARARHERKAIR